MFGDPGEGKLASQERWAVLKKQAFGNERARAVYCGGAHTHVLTERLEVFSFGRNKKGQLGLSRSDFQYSPHSALDQPMHVDYLASKAVCYISVGDEHSLALTLNGLVYAWGANYKGQLGICTLGPEFLRVGMPRLLENLAAEPGVFAGCGKFNSFIGVVRAHPDGATKMFRRWTRSLVQADRIIQERANYRYTLARREINREKLTRAVQAERCSSVMSTRSVYTSRNGSPNCSTGFWTRDLSQRPVAPPHHRRGITISTEIPSSTVEKYSKRGRRRSPGKPGKFGGWGSPRA